MRVLLSGASGRLGGAVHTALVEAGHDVTLIARSSGVSGGIVADLTDPIAVTAATSTVDVVVHAAGKIDVGTTDSDNESMAAAFAAAARVSRLPLINLSSLSVYGRVPSGRVDETARCSPVTDYGRSKLGAEQLLDDTGTPVCHLRVGNVFSTEMLAAAIGRPLKRVLKGGEITNLCFADDVADVVVFLLSVPTDRWPRRANVVRPDIGGQTWDQLRSSAGRPMRRPSLPPVLPHLIRRASSSGSLPANTFYDPVALQSIGYTFVDIESVAPVGWQVRRAGNRRVERLGDLAILYGVDSIDPELGAGTASRTMDIAVNLARRGARCTTVSLGTTDQPSVERSTVSGVENIVARRRGKRFWVPGPGFSSVERAVVEHDVLHLMGHWSPTNVALARMAQRHGIPYVICAAGSLKVWGRSRHLKRAFDLAVGHRYVTGASGYIAVVADELPDFAAHGVTADQVTIIPNGASAAPESIDRGDLADRRERLGLARPYVLFLGRLDPIKGPDLLLDAFVAVADRVGFDVVFAGPDNGLLGSLAATAVSGGVDDRVHFVGFVSGADKAALLDGCEALVVPSRSEAMSMVVLEVAAYEKPTLATTECGLDELLVDGAGWIVAPTAVGIASGLCAIEASPDRECLGKELARRVDAVFGWESVADRYLTLFRRVVNAQ